MLAYGVARHRFGLETICGLHGQLENMRIFAVASLVGCISLNLMAAPPTTMTKIVVRLSGPGIKENSPAALPKTIYVADPHYARIEDPPDARQGLQKLTIIAEPDAYSVNLISKKGSHVMDQGGPNDLHLPVMLPFDPRHKFGTLDRLEFGDELEFFEDAGAAPEAGPIINSEPTDAYVLKSAQVTATLVLRSGTHVPVTLSWACKDGKYTYEYITYEELPFDPKLFARPAGISYKEILPDSSTDRG
jgi:hypothetical protein